MSMIELNMLVEELITKLLIPVIVIIICYTVDFLADYSLYDKSSHNIIKFKILLFKTVLYIPTIFILLSLYIWICCNIFYIINPTTFVFIIASIYIMILFSGFGFFGLFILQRHIMRTDWFKKMYKYVIESSLTELIENKKGEK